MKNPQLKSAYAEDEYTPANILELKRCHTDPIYFMENYIKVTHPVKGAVPFKLYDYQHEMIDAMHNQRSTILLCSRQMGKCFSSQTTINTIEKPKGLKKFILKILDRNLYNDIFRNSTSPSTS